MAKRFNLFIIPEILNKKKYCASVSLLMVDIIIVTGNIKYVKVFDLLGSVLITR